MSGLLENHSMPLKFHSIVNIDLGQKHKFITELKIYYYTRKSNLFAYLDTVICWIVVANNNYEQNRFFSLKGLS